MLQQNPKIYLSYGQANKFGKLHGTTNCVMLRFMFYEMQH